MTSDRPVEPLEAQALLVERDREEEPDREREEHGRRREDERPGEHATGTACGRAGRGSSREVLEADVRLPARLELLPCAATNEPLPLSRKTLPSLDADEHVALRVVPERRRRARPPSRALRLDAPLPSSVGTRERARAPCRARRARRPSRACSPSPRSAARPSDASTSAAASGFRPSVGARRRSCRCPGRAGSATSSPCASRATAMSNWRPLSVSAERVALIAVDRLVLGEDVAGRVVREGDVDRVDDRDRSGSRSGRPCPGRGTSPGSPTCAGRGRSQSIEAVAAIEHRRPRASDGARSST